MSRHDPEHLEDTTVLDLKLDALFYEKTQVLGRVHVGLAAGETLALVGPSGVGKSSLLRAIAGIEQGYEGTCKIKGRVAMVFQEPTLLPWRTATDNIRIPTGLSQDAAYAALEEVGLAAQANAFPGAMSLGQQRRLSLARAFAVRPDLLLMDEPFVSLDPDLVEEMMMLFSLLRAEHGVATVLVTHVAEEARKLADRIVTIGGQPATILSEIANAAPN